MKTHTHIIILKTSVGSRKSTQALGVHGEPRAYVSFSRPTEVFRIIIMLILMAYSAQSSAGDPFYLGVGSSIGVSRWSGDNNGNSDGFSANAAQLGINLSFQKGNFYGGFNLQGGKFEFEDGSPDRIKENDQIMSSQKATIARTEFDLIFGYYFWPKISLFLDIKNVGYDWDTVDYSYNSTGIGFGVSGFIPLSQKWTLYGSVGLMPLRIESGGTRIGDGGGGALTFGAQYKTSANSRISVNLNNQGYNYEFDNDQKQDHNVGSISFGYNYYFKL